MPKIEIELSEIERLKDEIQELTRRLEKAEGKMHEVDEATLLGKAQRVAAKLFTRYLEIAFSKLGFDEVDTSLHYWIGEGGIEKWWDTPEVAQLEVSAHLTEYLSTVMVKIGCDMERIRERAKPSLDAILDNGVTKP